MRKKKYMWKSVHFIILSFMHQYNNNIIILPFYLLGNGIFYTTWSLPTFQSNRMEINVR